MRHSFLDKYSQLHSPIHHLDPRVKLALSFAFILGVVTTPPTLWPAFVLYLILLWCLILISRLPPLFVLVRSLIIIPFVVVVAVFVPFFSGGGVAGSYSLGPWQVTVSHHGLMVLWNVVVKAWLSVQALILLSSTTRLPDLLRGMQGLGMPRVLIMILSFMYRYLFVLIDEVMRMRQARDSRNFGGKRLWQWKTIGSMAGSLFLRSYERGERVYMSMMARGFDGQVRSLRRLQLSYAEVCLGVACLFLVVAVNVVPRFAFPM
ncbi:MAG TPA: cobalt ECF transporter T component CbiQ [Dehalococcoidia bacterium]|nr:cobalt ECF transporter T component CbiQ [Dehalococcoidia bacterium]